MAHDLKILHAADFHGNISHYWELLFLAEKEKADCIVIGGDLLPGGRPFTVLLEAQRRFIIDCLRPLFENFREVNREKTIYLMMGNDDFAVNMDRLEEMESDGFVKLLHLRSHTLTDSLSKQGTGVCLLLLFS